MNDSALPPQEQEERVHIYDHPDSRIAFLETTLADKEWRATIYASALDPGQNLTDMAHQLNRHGYHAEIGKDEQQHDVLHVLHLPSEAGLLASIKTLGLTEGIHHTFNNMSAGKLLQQAKKGVDYFVHDKAHLISAFYITGDVFLLFSGMGNKSSEGGTHAKGFREKLAEFKHPENALQSISAIGPLMTSIILMVYAKEGNSGQYRRMKEQFYKTLIHGKDPTDMANWEAPSTPHGILAKLDQTLHDHGLGGAVTAQTSGMLLQMLSGGIRWKKEAARRGMPGIDEETVNKNIRGSKLEIGRGMASSLGWLALLYPAHEVKDKVSFSSHPVKRTIQEYQETPGRFASALTITSSLLAMQAGREKNNFSQYVGEATLLLGDAVIFFTNTSEYGDGTTKSPEALAKTAAKFIAESPVLLNKEQKESFTLRLSHYLAGHGGVQSPNKPLEEESGKLVELIHSQMEKQPDRLQDVQKSLADLVSQLPASNRESALKALCTNIVAMPGVFVDAEELAKGIREHIIPTISPAASFSQVAEKVATLMSHLPALSIGSNAMRIYDTLTQFVPSSPRDMLHLNHALKQQIQQQTGVPTSTLNQIEQQARTQGPSLH